jgi:hypothetical protein
MMKRPSRTKYILYGLPAAVVALVGTAAGIGLCLTVILILPGVVLIIFSCWSLAAVVQAYLNELHKWQELEGTDLSDETNTKPWEEEFDN